MKEISVNIFDRLSLSVALFLGTFERRENDRPYLLNIISGFLIVGTLCLATGYLSKAFQCSLKKDLWLDEQYTLDATIHKESLTDMVLHGAIEQASTAPLDYVILKIYDDIRPQVRSFGLPKNVYYRLHSVLSTLLVGVLMVLVFFGRIRKDIANYLIYLLQVFLLLAAVGFYFFWFFNFQYSIEMRPYSLWNALWFAVIFLYMHYGKLNGIIVVLLTLLSATASGAVFQIAALATSIAVIGLIKKEWSIKRTIEILKALTLPSLVCLYYISLQPGYGSNTSAESQQHYRDFYHFWITKEKIPVLSILGVLMTVRIKDLRPLTVAFVSTLILYLASPIMNYLVVSKGYFFSSRQYIYYDLIYPVFFIAAAVMLPVYGKFLKRLTL